MKIINQVFEMVPVAILQTHPANARRGDIASIGESIKTNGFFGACVVQKSTNFICVGNHRFLSAIAENATEIPVLWADITDEEAKRIALADNKTADGATYDEQALVALLMELNETEGKLVGTGYSQEEADELLQSLNGDWDAAVVDRGHARSEDGSDAIERIVIHAPRSIIANVKTAVEAIVVDFPGVTIE